MPTNYVKQNAAYRSHIMGFILLSWKGHVSLFLKLWIIICVTAWVIANIPILILSSSNNLKSVTHKEKKNSNQSYVEYNLFPET